MGRPLRVRSRPPLHPRAQEGGGWGLGRALSASARRSHIRKPHHKPSVSGRFTPTQPPAAATATTARPTSLKVLTASPPPHSQLFAPQLEHRCRFFHLLPSTAPDRRLGLKPAASPSGSAASADAATTGVARPTATCRPPPVPCLALSTFRCLSARSGSLACTSPPARAPMSACAVRQPLAVRIGSHNGLPARACFPACTCPPARARLCPSGAARAVHRPRAPAPATRI
jgi:hypothetical protein